MSKITPPVKCPDWVSFSPSFSLRILKKIIENCFEYWKSGGKVQKEIFDMVAFDTLWTIENSQKTTKTVKNGASIIASTPKTFPAIVFLKEVRSALPDGLDLKVERIDTGETSNNPWQCVDMSETVQFCYSSLTSFLWESVHV